MRILVISNLYPPHAVGGYEERCRQVTDSLRARGHEVHVLTSDFRLEGVEADEPHVRRILEIHGFFGRPWLPVHRLFQLERRNHERLQRVLDEVRPELVHVWNMGGISKSLLLRLEAGNLPVVYDISDHWIARSLKADVWLSWWNDPGTASRRTGRRLLGWSGLRRWVDRRVPTRSYKDLQFRRIYFCSAFMRDLTADKGYPVRHGSVIYCGVEAERFPRKQDYRQPRRLLWVGRLAEDKDPLTAIEAMGRIQSGPLADCRLHIFGRGDPGYTALLEQRVRELHLQDRVEFRFARHAELMERYRDYDALLFTSNWGEPFALTPLEAMAAGLPVLLCPDGGDQELGRDGENCLLIQPADPNSIVQALERLESMPDHGASMAALARAELLERYDQPVIVDQIEAFLTDSLRA